MVIAIGLAAVAQPADALREPPIVGHDRASVAERAEILRGIEAERPGHADRTDRPPGCGRQVGLAAVLDNRQMVARRDALDRRHVGGLAVQVDWQDGARAWSDGARRPAGI